MVDIGEKEYYGEKFGFISETANKLSGAGIIKQDDYKFFNEAYGELIVKKANNEDFEELFVDYLKKVLEDVCNNILDTIKNNRKILQTFSEEEITIEKIKKGLLTKRLKYEEQYNLKQKLWEIGRKVEDKINLEKRINFNKWKERVLGFIIGIIASLILYYFGFR